MKTSPSFIYFIFNKLHFQKVVYDLKYENDSQR